jgi:MFS transporter, PPP family, 3-phenylpropionic acid transporter
MPPAVALRLAAYYGATFATVGVWLPFFPVWLEQARGFGPEAIGWIIAAGYWPRVVTTLLITRSADRSGERRRPMVVLAGLTLVLTAALAPAHGFWPVLLLVAAGGVTFAAVLPLGEAIALDASRRRALDYGRVRLVGSATFILAAIAAGALIEARDAGVVLPLLIALLAAQFAACLTLPAERAPPHERPLRLRDLWGQPGLPGLLMAAALIQASHSVYYGFATLHWHAAGHSGTVIGWLWAEGVIAEIVLFALAGRFAGRISPGALLTLAGALTVARWAGTGLSTHLGVLAVMQALHGASFGASHLAVMHKIRDEVAPELQASAQGAYASLSALLFGILTPLSGRLYGAFAGGAFLVMAATALLGTALALALRTAPAGEAQPRAGPGR